MSKPQILIVHGGETFKTHEDYIAFLKNMKVSLILEKKWKNEFLDREIGDDYEIIRPQFPNALFSQYEEWRIVFEKYLEICNPSVLIGNSLGATFLARFLAENKLRNKFRHVYLIAAVFDNTLPDYDMAGGFVDMPEDLSLVQRQTDKLTFMYSKDDKVVPIDHLEKFRAKLPEAEYIIYESMGGHFQVSEFPEIVPMLKKDLKLV